MKKFLLNQLEQMKKGGIRIIVRKLWIALMLICALPFVLIIRLIRPLVFIRLGEIYSNRIGHFATNTALYFCRRPLNPVKSLDLFYHNHPVSNSQLKKMWDRKLITYPLFGWWEKANRLLPGGEKHMVTEHIGGRDPLGLYAQADIPLVFTDQEEQHGQEGLRKLGIPEGARFVCFVARTSTYLQRTFPTYDYSYHSYRDMDVVTYVPAIKELIARGYYVVRMGQFETNRLPIQDPQFIDYAIESRNDFMDIYLGAKCHFFVGSPSGLVSVPRLFKKPIAWVNYIPVKDVHSWDSNSYFIPKKIWSVAEKRFLTYPELLTSARGHFYEQDKYVNLGLTPVDNSDQEITDLVIEVEERLSGKWAAASDDEQMQERFWKLYQPPDHKFHGVFRAAIGSLFLRKNRDLFEHSLQIH